MPAFFRHRTPSPTGVPVFSNTPPKAVAFPSGASPVTSISRPLSNAERWTLYYFESHARLCSACVDPYHVHKAHRRLCSEGHRFAQDVAKIMYSTRRGRDVFDAGTSARRSSNATRIELPRDYDEVRSLLRAMERSLRHRDQKPIVNFERTYIVAQYPIISTPSRRRSYVEPVGATLDADVRTPRPRRSLSTSRSPPHSSSLRSGRRKSMTPDWPQQALTYDVRAPPSTWRKTTVLPQDDLPAQRTEPRLRPAFHRAQRSQDHEPLIASSTPTVAGGRPRTPVQRPVSNHGSKSTTPQGSPVSQPLSTSDTTKLQPEADALQAAPQDVAARPITPPRQTTIEHGPAPDVPQSRPKGDALQSSHTDPTAKPVTPPRQACVAQGPAPDVPRFCRPHRPSMLISGEQKRRSWYAGQPYETELREPKSFEQVEKEMRKTRRYSTYLY